MQLISVLTQNSSSAWAHSCQLLMAFCIPMDVKTAKTSRWLVPYSPEDALSLSAVWGCCSSLMLVDTSPCGFRVFPFKWCHLSLINVDISSWPEASGCLTVWLSDAPPPPPLTLHVVVQVPVLSLYKLLVRNLLVLYHYTHNPMKLRYRWLAAMTATGSEALTFWSCWCLNARDMNSPHSTLHLILH